jgi:hypothetical protein
VTNPWQIHFHPDPTVPPMGGNDGKIAITVKFAKFVRGRKPMRSLLAA